MSVTALVLCGGSSRRLGRDKLAEPLGPSTVLDVTLAGLPGGLPIVAVGPQRPTERPVTWTAEHPAGPCAAALAAALLEDASLDAVAATTGVGGPPNPLLAAYRTRAVRRALPDEPRDGRARTLLDALPHRSLVVPAADAVDVDTPDALAAARRRVDP
jgi:molybdopterin-guanine dinucleotide biosynthesis protein A